MLSNVDCIFLKPACEGEIRLTSSANELNRLFNILVKTLLKQLSRLKGFKISNFKSGFPKVLIL